MSKEPVFEPEIYNPWDESEGKSEDEGEEARINACMWELLRRNEEFKKDVKAWIGGKEKKPEGIVNHFHGRIALKWMIPESKKELLLDLVAEDVDIYDLKIELKSPLKSKTKLTLKTPWKDAPLGFKRDFKAAFKHRELNFQRLSELLEDRAYYSNASEDQADEKLLRASKLLKLYTERCRTFAIPRFRMKKKDLTNFLTKIKEQLLSSEEIDSGTYHGKAFLGSPDHWLAYLLKEKGKPEKISARKINRRFLEVYSGRKEPDIATAWNSTGKQFKEGSGFITDWINESYPDTITNYNPDPSQ